MNHQESKKFHTDINVEGSERRTSWHSGTHWKSCGRKTWSFSQTATGTTIMSVSGNSGRRPTLTIDFNPGSQDSVNTGFAQTFITPLSAGQRWPAVFILTGHVSLSAMTTFNFCLLFFFNRQDITGLQPYNAGRSKVRKSFRTDKEQTRWMYLKQ